MAQLKTIILAAGKGSRFKSDTPKVLHLVAGRPALHYVLDVAEAAGSLKTYVVAGHRADTVKSSVKGRAEIVIQKEQRGTADAVRACARRIQRDKGSVLVMCGDTPLLDRKIVRRLVDCHRKTLAACTVLTALLEDPSGYGRIVRDGNGEIAAIREEKDAIREEKMITEINTGVYCFDARLLFGSLKDIKVNLRKKEFYLTDIVEIFLRQGRRVKTLITQDWTAGLGINTRSDLAFAEAVLRDRILFQLMDQGVTIVDPATTYVEHGAVIGRDTVIYPCSYIHRDVRIGKRCSIGPFARLRPGARVGNDVVVGNFTEVSRSRLGDGVTMKHFSFLGDAVVGQKANIACGAVTANYDGKNKNRTEIGPNAFIGCDAVMVAPVKIGHHATVGAGSVVTAGKNIVPYGVAVGVPARVIKKGKGS